MGCVASRIDKDGRVQVCKQRKRLMKQLVGYRGEFADAQLAYLRALKNTGATLRQFTESESLELDNASYGLALPPSPPLPLPPSPPPPPPFSPEFRKGKGAKNEEVGKEDVIEFNQDDDSCTPPPPPLSSSWEFLDPFGFSSSPHHQEKSEAIEHVDEDNWEETKTEFEEEVTENNEVNPRPVKPQSGEVVDDNSSNASWYAKESTSMPMVVWRGKCTLEGIVKKLDDHFLKASACGKEIAVIIDINQGDNSLPWNYKDDKRKRSSSTKVFSALSWSWSSKSLLNTRDSVEHGSSEPCRPGAHCITLDRLYAAEQKLYKEVKEEEIAKLEHEKKSKMLLQKQEGENQDWTKAEKIRSSVESLEMDMARLQNSISHTISSILELIDEELYPQLIMLVSGLAQMWRTMFECHQFQNHIAQQLNHLSDDQEVELSTEFHRRATAQLESEIECWYNSFCHLVKSQQVYVTNLSRWIQLTDCLMDNHQRSNLASSVRKLSDHWLLASEKLPDKAASGAIKNFLVAIQLIIQQQGEEMNQQKRSYKLEKRLQKEQSSLAELERKVEGSLTADDSNPNHPLSLKRAKTEGLIKRVDEEKAKYLNSVQVSKTMTLNNLKTSLPNVFKALIEFSNASTEAFEAIQDRVNASENSTS